MIQVDTREQNNSHIVGYFVRNDIPFVRSKLYVGDYCEFNNPALVIERKNSLLEMAGNCGKNHDRFKAELERLDEINGRMVLLIEETTDIAKWQHARSEMKGETMKKILDRWQEKHCMTVIQCERHEAGQKIFEILEGVK